MNPIKKKLVDLKNTRKNWGKVQSSPYAKLELSIKARKIIVYCLIPWLMYMAFRMVRNVHISGIMGTVNRVFMIGIMSFLCWKIYKIIPAAEKQLKYYKKYPHTINYCPTNTKDTIDDILKNIENNKSKENNKEVKNEKNIPKEKSRTS